MANERPKQENPYVRLRKAVRSWALKVTNPRTRVVNRFSRADCERGASFDLRNVVQQVRTAGLCDYEVHVRLSETTLDFVLVEQRPNSMPEELYSDA